MSNIRKHGVYAVEETHLEGRKGSVNSNKSWTPISYGMEVVYKQMKIAGNRSRTIQRFEL